MSSFCLCLRIHVTFSLNFLLQVHPEEDDQQEERKQTKEDEEKLFLAMFDLEKKNSRWLIESEKKRSQLKNIFFQRESERGLKLQKVREKVTAFAKKTILRYSLASVSR